MKVERLVIRNQVYVRLTHVAACYRIEQSFIEEVYSLGLLGHGETVDDHIAIAVTRLDRLARIVQLHFYLGVNLEGIAGLLGTDEPADS